MKKRARPDILAACIVCLAMRVPDGLSQELAVEEAMSAEIAKIARIQMAVFEDTKKSRNERLNELFREYIQRLDGKVTAWTVKQFNAMLKEHGLTNFDDFLAAETTPLRYVKDPASGDMLPVFGALGSDLINAWLAEASIIESKPLDGQPMYDAAANALCEHVDFALIGMRDPNLSLELLPSKLRGNAKWAYQRLNPTNKFDGGFDHPLFYATIREAAKKLFRQDYPKAKMTMADLVVPEEQGGFGIRSCLLCHDRDHTNVYKRLLGQGLYFEAKAEDLIEGSRVRADAGTAGLLGADDEANEAKAKAAVFQRAARTVLNAFPDKIDDQAVRSSLAMLSRDNLARLKPGYDDFCTILNKLGCLKCHSTDSNVPRAMNPATHGAFVLDPGAYYKTKNIKALCSVINLDDISKSKLLLKAAAMVRHKGATEVKLEPAQVEELRSALAKWLYSFRTDNLSGRSGMSN